MPAFIPWTFFAIGALISLFALWVIAPHVPLLRSIREALEQWAEAVVQAFRDDPPPLYFLVRNIVRELVAEYGPQLQSSTNRNAILLALTSFFGVVMPPELAARGAAFVVVALTVFYLLRTMAGRKRAAGPILTPSDLGIVLAAEREAAAARGEGAEWEANKRELYAAAAEAERATGDEPGAADAPMALTIDAGLNVRVAPAKPIAAPAPIKKSSPRRGAKAGKRPTRPAAKKKPAKKKAAAKRRRA